MTGHGDIKFYIILDYLVSLVFTEAFCGILEFRYDRSLRWVPIKRGKKWLFDFRIKWMFRLNKSDFAFITQNNSFLVWCFPPLIVSSFPWRLRSLETKIIRTGSNKCNLAQNGTTVGGGYRNSLWDNQYPHRIDKDIELHLQFLNLKWGRKKELIIILHFIERIL